MKKIYRLTHVFMTDDYFEEMREIGVFSTEEKARLALEEVRTDPFLTTCPKNFSSFRFEINDWETNKIRSWKFGC